MQTLIGLPLDEATKVLREKNKPLIFLNNNHNVVGDMYLVTNVIENEEKIIVVYGEFIFDIKGN